MLRSSDPEIVPPSWRASTSRVLLALLLIALLCGGFISALGKGLSFETAAIICIFTSCFAMFPSFYLVVFGMYNLYNLIFLVVYIAVINICFLTILGIQVLSDDVATFLQTASGFNTFYVPLNGFFGNLLSSLLTIDLIVLFAALLGRTKSRAFVARIGQRRAYNRPPPALDLPKIGLVAIPLLFVTWGIATLFGLTRLPASLYSATAENLRETYPFFQIRVLPACLLAAVWIHSRPNHSRKLKYFFLLLAIPLPDILYLPRLLTRNEDHITDLITLPFSPFRTALGFQISYMLVIVNLSILSLIYLAVSVGGAAWIDLHGPSTKYQAKSFARLCYMVVRSSLFPVFVVISFFLNPPILPISLVARYVTIEYFRRRPIIYLRSFRHDGAAESFGRAIASAVSPFGVLIGLVHAQQTNATLLARTSVWQQGLMMTVADAYWRDWVDNALRAASLVIIDVSITTESVDWELQNAIRAVDRRRLLLVSSNTARPEIAGDVAFIPYETGTKGMKILRMQIREWIYDIYSGYNIPVLVRRSKVAIAALMAVTLAVIIVNSIFGLSLLPLI